MENKSEVKLSNFTQQAFDKRFFLSSSFSTSTGEIIATLPSLYLTGVAFGGPNRDILFVVTSSIFLDTVTLQVLDVAPAPPLYMINGVNATGNVSKRMSCDEDDETVG